MRWLGSVALLSALLLLTACSALSNERSQPADSQEPAPPIESMNEVVPVPPDVEGESGKIVFDQSYEEQLLCPYADPEDCKPAPELVEALRRQLQKEHEGMNPAEGEEQRAIARLPLTQDGGAATLIAWRARNGRLCTKVEYRYPDRHEFGIGGGYGPFGPCEPRISCGQICVQRVIRFSRATAVAAGTVSSSGDQLRIVFLDGKGARYPLRGPVVPGFPERRVFMVDLGQRLYQRLELLVDDETRASVDILREEIEAQLCHRRFPHPNPELQACLRNASQEDKDND
jgi:hypothetical protein